MDKGEIFGEIALMTQLERTCTVVSREISLILSFDKNGLDIIEEFAPKIYNSLFDQMHNYEDDDMI